MALNIYDKNNLYKLVETKDIEKNINITESLSAGLNVYTGSKTKGSDGTMGAVLSNTGNLHLTSAIDNSPGIYFYRSLATSATHTILALSDSFKFNKQLEVPNIKINGTNGLVVVFTFSKSNVTVGKNGTVTETISCSQTGWTPVCLVIATLGGSYSSYCNVYSAYMTDNTANVLIRNFNTSNDATVEIVVRILMRYSG